MLLNNNISQNQPQLCQKCINEALSNTMAQNMNSIPFMSTSNNTNLSALHNVHLPTTIHNQNSQFAARPQQYISIDNLSNLMANSNSFGSNMTANLSPAVSSAFLGGRTYTDSSDSDRFAVLRQQNKIIYDSHDAMSNVNAFNELPNFEAYSDRDGNVELYFKNRPKTILIDIPCEFCEKFAASGSIAYN